MTDHPTPTTPPPVEHPSRPRVALPPGACDAHFHVFGPHARFPFAPERTFTPVDVPRERVLALHRLLGIERGVCVQSACHGTDHAALLDLLAAGGDRYRGVALITPRTPPEEVARLAAAGVRGLRVSHLPHLGEPPTTAAMEAMVALGAPHGWHLQLHVAGTGIARLADWVRGLGTTVVVDHLARPDPEDTTTVRALEELLDTGRVWCKLSGVDRVSEGPAFTAGVALARRLARHAPERVVWGTDFPHPNHPAPPDDGRLVDRLGEIAGDEAALERILVANPAALYGF